MELPPHVVLNITGRNDTKEEIINQTEVQMLPYLDNTQLAYLQEILDYANSRHRKESMR